MIKLIISSMSGNTKKHWKHLSMENGLKSQECYVSDALCMSATASINTMICTQSLKSIDL